MIHFMDNAESRETGITVDVIRNDAVIDLTGANVVIDLTEGQWFTDDEVIGWLVNELEGMRGGTLRERFMRVRAREILLGEPVPR